LPRLDLRRLIAIGLLAALTLTLLLTLGGGRATLTIIAQADWRLLALAAAVHYIGFALRGQRWQTLLAALGHPLGYFYTLTVLLAGWFVSALLPARAGDLFRVFALYKPPPHQPAVPVADTLGTIVLERALDIFAILLLSAGFSFVVLQGRIPGWLLGIYGAAVALLVVLGVLLLVTPHILEGLRGWSARPLWQKALTFMAQIAGSLHTLARRPAIALLVVGESLVIWLCDGLLLWLVANSLGAALGLGAAGFVALTVDIFAAVPLTPGGMGQVETAYAALLALLAHPGLPISAVVLATRAISYWSFLVISGLVTLFAGFGRHLTELRP
jgi:uncharacterized protein (TIRG00374 family)